MIKNTFEEQILMGRLPSSPGVARLLVEFARRESLSPAEIASAIRVDPALTGRLLKRAQPLSPASAKPVETVEAAIELLGPRELLLAVRDLSLVTDDGPRECPNFDYERYWATSLARAVAMEVIVRSTLRGSPEAAYTLGLLADIGRLALASVYPSEYSALLAACPEGQSGAISRLEREHLEIDHAEVGACLFEHWGLRRSFARAVCLYEGVHAPADTEDAEALDLAGVLRCAQQLAEERVDSDDRRTSAGADRALPHLRDGLGLSEEAARRVHAEVARVLSERIASAWVPIGIPSAAREDATPVVEPDEVDTSPRSGKGLRILAVDDDPTSLAQLRRVLEQAGHDVKCASDGIEALQIALQTNLQAVVADWMMPQMDGVELCKALRFIQSGREMFFILLTGRDQEDQVVEAYDSGVDEYVTKPFNPKILLARIRAGQRVMELKEEVDIERQVTAQQVRELGLLNRRLRTAALTDPLTGLPNRRCAWDRLSEEWQNSTRAGTPMAVMMVDIDTFKNVNDRHGHEIGDLVLKEVAEVLRSRARQGEGVARLGGEEFVVVCPNSTATQAAVGAERLRAAIEGHVIHSPGFSTNVTVSLGVAERTPDMPGIDALLKAADAAVYLAKSAGRNQVKVAESAIGRELSA
jgi:two-component system cell cycle response regulator